MQQVGYELEFDWQGREAPGRGSDVSAIGALATQPAPLTTADGFHLPARRASQQPKRLRARSRRRVAALPLALVTAFAALTGAFAYNLLTDGGRQTRAGASPFPDFDRVTDALGLGLEQATLTGQRFTADADVYDALRLGDARSLLRFDGVAARERIERLPWVESASITRIFPGRIDVRIIERTAFALWQTGDRHVLVDRSGRELSPVDPRDHASLPRIAGAGAPAEAASLFALIARYPLIAGRLERADRIDGRRWTLHLAGNVVLVLPADREALALDQVTQGSNIAQLVATGGRIIDLRSQGRIAVRRSEGRSGSIQHGAQSTAFGQGESRPAVTSAEAGAAGSAAAEPRPLPAGLD